MCMLINTMSPDNTTRENSKSIKQVASNASLELFTAAFVKKMHCQQGHNSCMFWKLFAYRNVGQWMVLFFFLVG